MAARRQTPHVVNRFMAVRDQAATVRGRRLAAAWACVIYVGLVALGWSGRLLASDLADAEQVMFHLFALLLPAPWVVLGIGAVAVLLAIAFPESIFNLCLACAGGSRWRWPWRCGNRGRRRTGFSRVRDVRARAGPTRNIPCFLR